MVREILLHTNPILRIECKEVDILGSTAYIKELIDDMVETMYDAPGYGLAANQIGESLCVFVIDVDWDIKDDSTRKPRVFINPDILEIWEPIMIREGCLSIPGGFVSNTRYNEITLSYRDLDSKRHEEVFRDSQAHAIQHEMDHLEGKLFIDDLTPSKRQTVLNKHKKFMRQQRKLKRK